VTDLSVLTEDQVRTQFDALQRKLVPLWRTLRSVTDGPQTVVVVPSVSFGSEVLDNLPGVQHFEERLLILLMLLRNPTSRLVYVTSQPILPSVIDYYLYLLPGVIPSQARDRLHLVSTLDGSVRPLTRKLLERPRLIQHLKSLIPDPDRAYMVPFNTTELERELALNIGIPILGADPKFASFGTKSGAKKVFRDVGVPCPAGVEDLNSIDEALAAIAQIRSENPGVEKVLVKTNQGVSGLGIIKLDLGGLPAPGDQREIAQLDLRLKESLDPAAYGEYEARLQRAGGVVEEQISGTEIRSPSVQLFLTPLAEVQILSTHDQLLGGEEGHNYVGCRFPADTSYALSITEEAEKIGKRLAAEGVLGRAAIDFVVVRSNGDWKPYAIEINLRQGGTTHPFLTLQFLTDGRYIPEEAIFIAPNGRKKFFVASDHVESDLYRGFTPDDLFDIVVRHQLHFDHSQQTGVVFHMMSALPEIGRTGLTAVADSPEEAGWIHDSVVKVLDEEAKLAFRPRPGPAQACDV